MKETEIRVKFEVYQDLQELPENTRNLMSHAFAARDKAYAPYSEFLVGAALLLENGEIITGSNQENAAYPSGLCAERTAIFYAGAKYPDVKIKQLVISVKSLKRTIKVPTPPCGSCRQAIAEYEFKQKQPIAIYFMGESGEILKSDSLINILPLAFDSSFM
ncbi:cytidine deaminase [Haloflavibacter putidus]|uniref:Cytidine deaminase n=1 Tax=Haloflavibacter putidus TaxID=2576776 RepID=A0A507ZD45_9FLAO|nr:cytidine deaminase [Haloflavibacter putidus]TQD34353.1 cytidine deaminase [Haloflavibacter putidus]